MLSKQYSVLVW